VLEAAFGNGAFNPWKMGLLIVNRPSGSRKFQNRGPSTGGKKPKQLLNIGIVAMKKIRGNKGNVQENG